MPRFVCRNYTLFLLALNWILLTCSDQLSAETTGLVPFSLPDELLESESALEDARQAYKLWRMNIERLSYYAESTDLSSMQRSQFKHWVKIEPEKRFVEAMHFYPGSGFLWEEDLNWSTTIVNRGLKVKWHVNHVIDEYDGPIDPITNSKLRPVVWEPYITAIGWWPISEDQSATSIERPPPFSFLHVIDNPLVSCVARSIDSTQSRTMRLTLKSEKTTYEAVVGCEPSFHLKTYTIYSNAKKTIQTYKCSEFKAIPNGSSGNIFLPLKVEYERHQKVQANDTKSTKWVRIIKDVDLNYKKKNDDFMMVYKPGEAILNKKTLEYRQVPGGLELFDSIIDLGLKIVKKTNGKE